MISGEAHRRIQKHGQRVSGTQPVSIAEVILGVPAEGAILAALQHQCMEEGQGKQQPGPCLGLLGAQRKGIWRQAAITAQQGSSQSLHIICSVSLDMLD